MSDRIQVKTSTTDKYPICIGNNLDEELSGIIRDYGPEKIFVVIDEFVFDHHYSRLKPVLRDHFESIHIYKVPRGEGSKSVYQYQEIIDFILTHGVERGTPLLAVGGGVTGDLAGFAAATVMRGIPLIHMPTTLLAMVDSSIGGKTGINHTTGKNLIGSFYQPDAVLADVRFLETLEEKEWVNGLSEVLKYGMIEKPDILSQAAALIDEHTFMEPDHWISLIRQSAQIKVDIVNRDVLEGGVRAYLNFGHTFAHVIEWEGNYTGYSHGEAVFAGMLGAIHASNSLGSSIDPANLLQFKPLYNLHLDDINQNTGHLFELMKRDKKVKNQQVKLILLHETGQPYVHGVKDPAIAKEAWNYILKTFNS